jgi:hypothetical protein
MEYFQDTTSMVEAEFGHDAHEEIACVKDGCTNKFMSNEIGAGQFIRYCRPCLEAFTADIEDIDIDTNTSQSSMMTSTGINVESASDVLSSDDVVVAADVTRAIEQVQVLSFDADGAVILQSDTIDIVDALPPIISMTINDILEVLLTMARTKTREPGTIIIGIIIMICIYVLTSCVKEIRSTGFDY